MSLTPRAEPPAVSIVIPGLNEAESLPELSQRIDAVLNGIETYEIIFVDDGSTADTWEVIQRLRAENPNVKGVRLRTNFGKAQALTSGFRVARGDIMMMMDADLQDDPADIPKFLVAIRSGIDVVVGWKIDRKDPLNRLVLTRVFNGTVRLATGTNLHDMNCGFKAFNRAVIETVPIYGDLFRFIPALAKAQGFQIGEVPVHHHARVFGQSRYGLERILRGLFDLSSVVFLTRYARRPMHLFGLAGLFLAGLGLCVELYLTVLWVMGEKIGDRPLLLLGAILMIVGVQFGSMGFIAEFLTYQQQKQRYSEDVPVREDLL